jgi:hypothetical protein
MLTLLVWTGVAAASFAAAAVLVFAIVHLTAYRDRRPRVSTAEPPWWPQFEREFAEYLGAGDGRPS